MFCSRDVIVIIQDFLEESGLIEEDKRPDEHAEQENKPQQRDEYQATQAAAHELNQLERLVAGGVLASMNNVCKTAIRRGVLRRPW
jgi:hypothetical protein